MTLRDELSRVMASIQEAYRMARAGEGMAGYEILDLERAWLKTPPVDPVTGEVGALEPWEAALAVQVRFALVAYSQAFVGSNRVPAVALQRGSAAETRANAALIRNSAVELRTHSILLLALARATHAESRQAKLAAHRAVCRDPD